MATPHVSGALALVWGQNPMLTAAQVKARLLATIDPIPALQKTKCPVLAIYGELDTQVPPADNRPKLEETLRTNGNQMVTIKLLPKANHALLVSDTGSMREFPYLRTFSPELLPTLSDWISGLWKKK